MMNGHASIDSVDVFATGNRLPDMSHTAHLSVSGNVQPAPAIFAQLEIYTDVILLLAPLGSYACCLSRMCGDGLKGRHNP
jgi:hypothetical protein